MKRELHDSKFLRIIEAFLKQIDDLVYSLEGRSIVRISVG